MTDLAAAVRTIPNFPKPGIMFRDITTLLANGEALAAAVRGLADPFRDHAPTLVAGMEARGFILGAAVAVELGVGFIPMRKPGKLPGGVIGEAYELEYGTDTLELHDDAMGQGDCVVLIDDLIATGGTALAAARLVRRTGATLLGAGFVIDLPELGGADRLRAADVNVHCLIAFDGH